MKVLFACGGSGGHMFPAFSVAEELKKIDSGAQIVYVCGNKDIENEIFKIIQNERLLSVESAPFRGAASLIHPLFLIKLSKGFLRSFQILRTEHPDLVAGFGGYVSFPMVAAARILGIPTLIHEQNVVPGLANKFLAGVVDGVALSFQETQSYLRAGRRVCVTGNPIRASIEKASGEEAMKFFGFFPGRRTILVLGGSQGAHSVNAVFMESVKSFPQKLREKIQVLHLCGRMSAGEAQGLYDREGVMARCYPFFDRMDLAYALADFAVGRAGATFLAEISAKKIPAILIPYPYSRGHQLVNARLFSRRQSCVVIEQKDLSAKSLTPCLLKFIETVDHKKKQGINPTTNSRTLLADFMVTLAQGSRNR